MASIQAVVKRRLGACMAASRVHYGQSTEEKWQIKVLMESEMSASGRRFLFLFCCAFVEADADFTASAVLVRFTRGKCGFVQHSCRSDSCQKILVT